jgi:hypothetical protein
MNCKICGSPAKQLFNKKVLAKYSVNYYQCTNCNFIQTDEPYWLNEAYSNAITATDIGLINRNVYFTEICTALLRLCGFDAKKKYLDYGGGYGIYVRMMRDKGFNFYWTDEYCENLYAKKFSADISKQNKEYELVTAFEVFEHLANPVKEIEKILRYSDSILFSTQLVNSADTALENWWYIAPEHGQHVAFYDIKTLHYIGAKYGLNVYSNNATLHLLTPKKLSSFKFKLSSHIRLAKLYNLIFPTNTLLDEDYELYLKDVKQA